MSQVVTATFQGGMLKPHEPLNLPDQAEVRLIIDSFDESPNEKDQAWQELEKLLDESDVDSRGRVLTRDQLHERHRH